MKTSIFVLCLLTQFTGLADAQTPMTAYRKDGIWHYFDTNGQLMWPALQDVANFPSGWVRGLLRATRWEVDPTKLDPEEAFFQRQVLYNAQGQVVLTPDLKTSYIIKTGLDEVGLVEMVGREDGRLLLCDRTGHLVYQAQADETVYLGQGLVAEPAGPDRFQVLKAVSSQKLVTIEATNFWGRFQAGGLLVSGSGDRRGLLLPTGKFVLKPSTYDLFESEESPLGESGLYCWKATGGQAEWTLIRADGTVLLSHISEPMTLHAGFFQGKLAAQPDTSVWFAVNGKSPINLTNDEVQLLGWTTDGNLVLQGPGTDLRLFAPTGQLRGRFSVNDEAPLVVGNFVWTHLPDSHGFQVWSQTGRALKTVAADGIETRDYGVVLTQTGEHWGLVKDDGTELATGLTSLEAPELHDGYLITRQSEGEGFRFEYYNFAGKPVFRTSSEADGWDWLLDQDSFPDYYVSY